jgi:hypothetical protein
MNPVSQKTGISVTITLLAVTAVFCGCGKSEPPASARAAQQPASPPAASASAPAATSASSAPSTASSSTPVPVDGDLPGVKIAVNELKRTSSTVTLKFTVYNTSGKTFQTQGVLDGDEYHRYRHVAAIHLIDGESKKKYFVVTDSVGPPLQQQHLGHCGLIADHAVAKFPASPNEVREITVEIPHFVPFEDVAIVQ